MDVDEVVFIVEEVPEGGYSAVCHRDGIYTHGEDLEDLRAMVKDAFDCCFEGESVKPLQIRLHFVCDEVIAA